jgi:DNA-binding protein YbaB
MTQDSFSNPLDALGGGFDLGAMLEQAQLMQEQLVQAQAELAATEVDGSVGGVTVTVNGTGEVLDVRFAAGAIAGTDEESLTDLGDLVVAAYRDARAKSDALAAAKLGPVTGGMDLGDMLGGSPLV